MSVTVLLCGVTARAYVLCVRLRYNVWRYGSPLTCFSTRPRRVAQPILTSAADRFPVVHPPRGLCESAGTRHRSLGAARAHTRV